jgi:hypothetical protein
MTPAAQHLGQRRSPAKGRASDQPEQLAGKEVAPDEAEVPKVLRLPLLSWHAIARVRQQAGAT